MNRKVGKGDAIVDSSADTLSTYFDDVRCTCVDFIHKEMITKFLKRFRLKD